MATTEYSAEVIEHYTNPRNPGALPGATGKGQAGEGTGGELLIQIHLRVSGEIIEGARFRAFGCSASIAAASVTTELLEGRRLDAALELEVAEVERALGGLPESKRHCAEYAAEAARAAVRDHLARDTERSAVSNQQSAPFMATES